MVSSTVTEPWNYKAYDCYYLVDTLTRNQAAMGGTKPSVVMLKSMGYSFCNCLIMSGPSMRHRNTMDPVLVPRL